ncbi:MFS transporter [Jatrophihabitans sp. YIM 134969]
MTAADRDLAAAEAADLVETPEATPAQVRRLEIAMLGAGLAGFGLMYCTQALLPAIGATFDVGPAAASLTVALTTGALALAVVPMSSLAESFGRARVMRVALAAACLLTVAGAFAAAFWQELVVRALVGLALAGVVAVAMGHLGDEVPPRVVGTAMGLYVSGNTLGGVTGRVVPAAVHSVGSWRVAVLVMAAVAALATVAFVLLLPAPRRFRAVPFDVGSHLRAVRDHLREPGIWRLCLTATLLMGGFVAVYNYLTYRLEQAPFDLPPSVGGLVFLAYLAGTVTSTLAGRLADRHGRRTVLLGSLAVMAVGLVLTVPDVLGCVVGGLVVFTGGFFGAHSTASGWVARRATSRRAQASALYLMAYYLGSSLGGSLLGLAWSAGGWPLVTGCVGVLVVAAALTAAGVREQAGVPAGTR